jgi:uncharacterized protein (TIGR03084 family)
MPSDSPLTVGSVIADLEAEHAALDAVVAHLAEESWRTGTPAAGWTVSDQIAHLTYFDGTATEAMTDPGQFQTSFEALLESAERGADGMDEFTLGWAYDLPGPELLEVWRAGRGKMLAAAEGLAEDSRVPWYGPSMGAKSFLTARLMETWAHGQDVVDAVGALREPTDRLRHIAQLGYITRKWTYVNREEDPPAEDVLVELNSPSGELWVWGDESAGNSVKGSAEDFCLVVCQRRNVADTDLVVAGPSAADWMSKAQAFAGPPTEGRRPAT